jgi:hypothetical protein
VWWSSHLAFHMASVPHFRVNILSKHFYNGNKTLRYTGNKGNKYRCNNAISGILYSCPDTIKCWKRLYEFELVARAVTLLVWRAFLSISHLPFTQYISECSFSPFDSWIITSLFTNATYHPSVTSQKQRCPRKMMMMESLLV